MIDNRTWRRTLPWAHVLGAPVAVVALLGLAACGTSTDTGTSTAASASTAAADDTAGEDDAADADPAAYQSCLEENGVSMPAPPAGAQVGSPPKGGTPPSGAPAAAGQGGPGGAPDQAPPGVDDDTWEAAQEACSDLAPTPPEGDASTASPDS